MGRALGQWGSWDEPVRRRRGSGRDLARGGVPGWDDFDLRSALAAETRSAGDYEAPRPSPSPMELFQIKGGLYSAKDKAHAAQHPAGLVLTATVVGPQERRLWDRGPATISVGKEISRFEDGKLGAFVENYNEFTHHFEEVLRAIGRLRDLLSAGAPEAPTDLTPTQKFALRPTDDTQPTVEKKRSYREWRNAQELYAAGDGKGGLIAGRVYEVARTGREFELARQAFWQAQGKLRRTIAEAKRLDKPKFEALDIRLSDIVSAVQGWWELAAVAVDAVLDARKKRAEYDAKMQRFAEIVKDTNAAVRDDFEAFRNAATVYWAKLTAHRTSAVECNKARIEARQKAALFGQALAPRSERRNHVLAAIRMPALVSDAWRALAIIGPPALKKLSAVLASPSLVERAAFHYGRSDPYGLDDVSQVIKAFKVAQSWKGVLTKDDVAEWVAMNRLWDETFNRFNV